MSNCRGCSVFGVSASCTTHGSNIVFAGSIHLRCQHSQLDYNCNGLQAGVDTRRLLLRRYWTTVRPGWSVSCQLGGQRDGQLNMDVHREKTFRPGLKGCYRSLVGGFCHTDLSRTRSFGCLNHVTSHLSREIREAQTGRNHYQSRQNATAGRVRPCDTPITPQTT